MIVGDRLADGPEDTLEDGPGDCLKVGSQDSLEVGQGDRWAEELVRDMVSMVAGECPEECLELGIRFVVEFDLLEVVGILTGV